jgi:uncharacterized cupredoxin-like copper-binding protein
MNTLFKSFAVAGLIAILTGCSSGTTAESTVTIAALDVKFNTQEISVAQGKPVKLVLDNKDQVLHDFSIDKLPVANKADHHAGGAHDMGGTNPDVHVSADGHKQGSIVFTPTQAGTYEFYCTVPGHKESGMVGRLVVR